MFFFFLYWFDKLSFQFEILITLTAFLHSKRVQTCFSFKVTLSKRYVIFRSKWNILYIYKTLFSSCEFCNNIFLRNGSSWTSFTWIYLQTDQLNILRRSPCNLIPSQFSSSIWTMSHQNIRCEVKIYINWIINNRYIQCMHIKLLRKS